MGRRKVELKRIEDKSSRQVTFSKRRSGLLKKARELSVLCDVEVAVFVFANRGKVFEFCSGNSLAKLVERYRSQFEATPATIKVLQGTEISSYLEGLNIDQMGMAELEQLEKQLDAASAQTKHRKAQILEESVSTINEQDMGFFDEEMMALNQNWEKPDEVPKDLAEGSEKQQDPASGGFNNFST